MTTTPGRKTIRAQFEVHENLSTHMWELYERTDRGLVLVDEFKRRDRAVREGERRFAS